MCLFNLIFFPTATEPGNIGNLRVHIRDPLRDSPVQVLGTERRGDKKRCLYILRY